jgi:hypothetical protein
MKQIQKGVNFLLLIVKGGTGFILVLAKFNSVQFFKRFWRT